MLSDLIPTPPVPQPPLLPSRRPPLTHPIQYAQSTLFPPFDPERLPLRVTALSKRLHRVWQVHQPRPLSYTHIKHLLRHDIPRRGFEDLRAALRDESETRGRRDSDGKVYVIASDQTAAIGEQENEAHGMAGG